MDIFWIFIAKHIPLLLLMKKLAITNSIILAVHFIALYSGAEDQSDMESRDQDLIS